MPAPFVEPHEDRRDCACKACTAHRALTYNAREVDAWMRWRPIRNALLISFLVFAPLAAAGIWLASSRAAPPPRGGQAAAKPSSLLKERAQCHGPKNPETCLRSALKRAYDAVSWQQHARLSLAREMLGNISAWSCIHNGEGSWSDNTGNGYYGGLQFDSGFERTYGRDMLQRYHGHADLWPPRAQIIVAQRAFLQGRGYAPWPATSHACGLR